MPRYDKMTRAELIEEIRALQRREPPRDELQRAVAELETHQAELEMQNRELREAQNLLEVSRDRYADLYDFAPLGYLTLSASGIITDLNLTAASMLGVERSRVCGFPLLRFVSTADVIKLMQHLRRCQSSERVHTEVELAPRAGKPLPIELQSVPARTSEGDPFFWTAIIDLTDRKRAETERENLILAEARQREAEGENRAKDEFLATLSHELRTPLQTVQGWVQLLRDGGLNDATTARGLDVMERSVQAQARLINDILDLSRIVRGELRVEHKPVDLVAVIETALASLRPQAETKPVRLEAELDPAAGSVSGDEARLQQVIMNLLGNALKFTPAGGSIHVRLESASRPGEQGKVPLAVLTVSDTGVGIESDFLPLLFERFRQADSSTTRRHGGIGLGLAITHSLVKLHGGTIRAASPGRGKGATFTVELPLVEGAARVSRESKPPLAVVPAATRGGVLPRLPNLKGLRVLAIDDDREALDIARRLVELLGARVQTAASGKEGLLVLQDFQPDVLLCDLAMPGEDGFSVIRNVRGLSADKGGRTPAIALTAFAGSNHRQKALEAGFNAYLAKPVELRDLAALITELCPRQRVLAKESRNGERGKA